MTETKAKAPPGKAKSSPKPVTFYSRSPNLRLVLEPEEVERNERGRVVKTLPATDVQFENGLFTWNPKEHEKELLEWLRGHPKLNTLREGAFWERGAPPDEPEPRLADQLDKIQSGLADRDREAIEAVLETERETHNRDVVIDQAESALVRMGDGGSDS